MNDDVSASIHSQPRPLLRRRNFISTSIVIVPTTSPSSYFHSHDLELLSIKRESNSYTSIKDLLPYFPVNSPMPSSDICIRDRLVKQAAWAYLQPMSASSGSAGSCFLFHRLAAFTNFLRTHVVRALHWMLRVIRVRSSR